MVKPSPPGDYKKLHKELKRIAVLERATQEIGRRTVALGLALLFLVLVLLFTLSISGTYEKGIFVIAAGIIGGYMALNIGANDVANNVGPAVGSRALTMGGALVIAGIFEAAGAFLAGGEVVQTVSKGIIDIDGMPSLDHFVWAMLAALLAAALWLNLATWLGAPVSTTHSIVGGVMGSGMAVAGLAAVDWGVMSAIAASWVISPVLGGVIAAALLTFVKFAVLRRDDKIAAATAWVPVLVAIMACAFTAFLLMKGLKRIWSPDTTTVVLLSAAMLVGSFAAVRPLVRRAAVGLENRRKAVARLFTVPLIVSAALLSFAHGANDVANAVGPLAAIVSAVHEGNITAEAAVPGWVMLIGGLGIAAGLVLFGPKLIRTVGEKITKLDPIRAFCVALSAAVTVIAASVMGLPVSSTHIAVGGVFGVGFLREFLAHWDRQRLNNRNQRPPVDAAPPALMAGEPFDPARPDPEKELRKAERRRLVRRSHLLTIGAAWVITVPCAALLAAGLYLALATVLG